MRSMRGERVDQLAQQRAVRHAVRILTDRGRNVNAIRRALALSWTTVRR